MTKSLLFDKGVTLDLETPDLIYDTAEQINMADENGRLIPAIDQPIRLPTNSKTKAAPGDDDPDPGGEHLY